MGLENLSAGAWLCERGWGVDSACSCAEVEEAWIKDHCRKGFEDLGCMEEKEAEQPVQVENP